MSSAFQSDFLPDQLRYFDSQLRPALVFLAILSFIMVYLFWEESGIKSALVWLGANLGIIGVRVMVSSYYRRMEVAGVSAALQWRFYWLFFLGIALNAGVWSGGAFLFFNEDSSAEQTMLAFIYGGISSGAMVALSVRREYYLGYLALFLFPVIYLLAQAHTSMSSTLSLILALYGLFLFITSGKHSEMVNANLTLIEHLKQAQQVAEAAAKAKGEFLANMSHEIRTPMNAIIGMTALALEGTMEEKERDYVRKANTAADNLLGIINDILDFSKIEAGKLTFNPEPFELRTVISQTLHIINVPAKAKGVKTRIKLDQNLPKFFCADALRLRQVLTNLANNAVKFSHEQGTVTLEVRLIDEDETDVLVAFSVEDDGIGISQANQEKLFRSFSQVDASMARKFGGTGLGLTISQSIVEHMGGKIHVESEEGKGSIFSFRISMEKADASALDTSSGGHTERLRAVNAALQGGRVLLVEDNAMNQELAEELLSRNGLQVTIAENGVEALSLLQTQDFDGVLMDCQMPVMDGYEATRRIRNEERFQELPILALTANVMEEDRERALEAGMNDIIVKPINPEKMLMTLAQWVRKKS